MRRFPLPFAVASLVAGLALAGGGTPVAEVEPDGFTHPLPQPLGAVGPTPVCVEGTLDPTHPTGLEPGDRDGFSFTLSGDAVAARLTSAVGASFMLALAEDGNEGPPAGIATVVGRSPLSLDVPGLVPGNTYRVGVAVFSDGAPAPYSLVLSAEDLLPPWSGDLCVAPAGETDPDTSLLDGTDLGDFSRILCGAGVLDAAPPEEGVPGDEDRFRFRNLLPVPARLTVVADPGEVRVVVETLVFVGSVERASLSFGDVGVLDLAPLRPGATYVLRLSTPPGSPARAYSFHLEPVAAAPPEPGFPVDLAWARIRLHEDPERTSFTVRGTFDPTALPPLDRAAGATVRVRTLRQDLGQSALDEDDLGRLVYRGLPGSAGIRRLVLDPFLGTLLLRGRRGDLGAAGDGEVRVEIRLGEQALEGGAEAVVRRNGRLLVVR